MNTDAPEIKKAIRRQAIVVGGTILTTFIVLILLLAKVIHFAPDAEFAHLLLKISIPITVITMGFQSIYLKLAFKQLKKCSSADEKASLILKHFSIRLNITLIPVFLNLFFLCLTNFDLFLTFNIVLILWMVNLFPFPEKIKGVFAKNRI